MVEHMYDYVGGRPTSRRKSTASLLARTSTGLDMVQWRSGRTFAVHDADRRLLEIPLVDVDPVRVGGQWQNRLNQHGLQFWQRAGQHIWYESALEAACLVTLDQAGEVERIDAQPFRLLFRFGAKSVRHDPDFFAIHRDGDQVVYDVKPFADVWKGPRPVRRDSARVRDGRMAARGPERARPDHSHEPRLPTQCPVSRFLAYTFPPRLPDPHHLVVLARPGLVRAARRPPRHLPDRAAPSFAVLLRRDQRGRPVRPLNRQAPHGAPHGYVRRAHFVGSRLLIGLHLRRPSPRSYRPRPNSSRRAVVVKLVGFDRRRELPGLERS